MSLITATSIQWGTDPCITSHELTELNYLFIRISCHSIWPISHLHTIPIERYAFLYALVTDASICFPSLFISYLVEVYRRSSKRHGVFFSVFIHRILLDLCLKDFPASELVHIISPIGATFLRQRAAQMKASSKCPRVKSSIGDASRPPPFGDPSAEEFVDPIAAVDPPPSSSSDASIRNMLETVITVQAAHGQILGDVFVQLQALRVDLVSVRHSTLPPPFDDDCPLAICHKKGEYLCMLIRGDFVFFVDREIFRLNLGDS